MEQFTESLGDRAVAYLNTDICVSNNRSILGPHVAPVLRYVFNDKSNFQCGKTYMIIFRRRETLFDATRAVPNYYDESGQQSYYDYWVEWNEGEVPELDLPCKNKNKLCSMTCGRALQRDLQNLKDLKKGRSLFLLKLYGAKKVALSNDIYCMDGLSSSLKFRNEEGPPL